MCNMIILCLCHSQAIDNNTISPDHLRMTKQLSIRLDIKF